MLRDYDALWLLWVYIITMHRDAHTLWCRGEGFVTSHCLALRLLSLEALGLMVQRKFRRTNSEKDVSYEALSSAVRVRPISLLTLWICRRTAISVLRFWISEGLTNLEKAGVRPISVLRFWISEGFTQAWLILVIRGGIIMSTGDFRDNVSRDIGRSINLCIGLYVCVSCHNLESLHLIMVWYEILVLSIRLNHFQWMIHDSLYSTTLHHATVHHITWYQWYHITRYQGGSRPICRVRLGTCRGGFQPSRFFWFRDVFPLTMEAPISNLCWPGSIARVESVADRPCWFWVRAPALASRRPYTMVLWGRFCHITLFGARQWWS